MTVRFYRHTCGHHVTAGTGFTDTDRCPSCDQAGGWVEVDELPAPILEGQQQLL